MVCVEGCPGMLWTEQYPRPAASLHLPVPSFRPISLLSDLKSWNWKLFVRDKDKVWPRRNPVGHGCTPDTCKTTFVPLIGGDHAVGINALASWKMGAIWSGPGRSGSGLPRAETCHLPTRATAWSFHHLALTRSLIPGLCRCETQWIGTGARLHRQGLKPVKVFFFFLFSLLC